jgi:hypothetical protein
MNRFYVFTFGHSAIRYDGIGSVSLYGIRPDETMEITTQASANPISKRQRQIDDGYPVSQMVSFNEDALVSASRHATASSVLPGYR